MVATPGVHGDCGWRGSWMLLGIRALLGRFRVSCRCLCLQTCPGRAVCWFPTLLLWRRGGTLPKTATQTELELETEAGNYSTLGD